MSSDEKLNLEKMIRQGEEETIEEEIEGVDHSISPAVSKQKPVSSKAATTKDSSSEVEGQTSSRNRKQE